jgi:hypothetical protein
LGEIAEGWEHARGIITRAMKMGRNVRNAGFIICHLLEMSTGERSVLTITGYSKSI